jgi:3-hydroxyisobutyrate dehydrogenase-like beta-hydroxyacid dehydrogenase
VTATDDSALIETDIFLSIVPPAAAGATAERFLPLIAKAGKKPVYIDCNAIAPQTLNAIARRFVELKLPFADVGIIGAPPRRDGSSPKFYMSGPITNEAETLKQLGLDTRVLSNNLGDASALKMSYAGITKGFQALGSAMALGAGRNGAADSLIAELKDSQPQLYGWLCRMLPFMYDKAYRWDGEMREIAKFLLPEQGASNMLSGAADLYEHIAAANREGPQSEIMSKLNRFIGK